MAAKPDGDATFFLLSELDYPDDIRLVSGFDDSQGLPFWSSVIEDSAQAGFLKDIDAAVVCSDDGERLVYSVRIWMMMSVLGSK